MFGWSEIWGSRLTSREKLCRVSKVSSAWEYVLSLREEPSSRSLIFSHIHAISLQKKNNFTHQEVNHV